MIALKKTTTTCEDFIDTLDNGYFYYQLIDEMYWDRGCDTELMWNFTLAEAKRLGVTLTDLEDFDYESSLYDLYERHEKGLS